jgi:hypothetical protein
MVRMAVGAPMVPTRRLSLLRVTGLTAVSVAVLVVPEVPAVLAVTHLPAASTAAALCR